eukprot:5937058-Ditylum_brightwellii.AAC.1
MGGASVVATRVLLGEYTRMFVGGTFEVTTLVLPEENTGVFVGGTAGIATLAFCEMRFLVLFSKRSINLEQWIHPKF